MNLSEISEENKDALICYMIDLLNLEYSFFDKNTPKYRIRQAQTVLRNIEVMLLNESDSSLYVYKQEHTELMSYASLCEMKRKLRKLQENKK